MYSPLFYFWTQINLHTGDTGESVEPYGSDSSEDEDESTEEEVESKIDINVSSPTCGEKRPASDVPRTSESFTFHELQRFQRH